METSRFILRDWKEEDVAAFACINSDERVMEFFLNRLTEAETIAFYHRIQKEFAECGYGLYAVECKETHAFLGYVGFHHFTFEADFAPGIEIGWRLSFDAWGKGCATEVATACLDYAKNTLKLKELYSFTSLPNKRSARVMQKIGMHLEKEFNHPLVAEGHWLQRHLLYKIKFC